MALNFPESLWISCELAQVSESRGHVYLSLVQKGLADELPGSPETILAQCEAVIWAKDHRRIKRQLGKTFQQILNPGLELLIQAKVEYHERYGLKLKVQDIDPAFTIGKLEMRRQATLKLLQENGLLGKNKQRLLPSVVQRIAVISSDRAAGFQDFKQQLNNNPYGYKIQFHLLSAAMQGDFVGKEVMKRLDQVNDQADYYDCAVIIRGGGARLDLVAFDDEALCTAIANCKLPVITGIGHEIDETLSDLVAYEALKTPTAVAEWIIQQNTFFEMNLVEYGQTIQALAQGLLTEKRFALERLQQEIQLNAKGRIQNQERLLSYIEEELPRNAALPLRNEHKVLEHFEALLKLLNPEEVLKRGFSMTMKGGKPITQSTDLNASDIIESVFADGRIKSKVIKS